MKPWLLNLLACPIDKHHPLQAYFFKWASTPEDIEEQLAAVGNTPNAIKDELKILAKQVVDGVISQAAVESIHDQSGVDAAVKFVAKSGTTSAIPIVEIRKSDEKTAAFSKIPEKK